MKKFRRLGFISAMLISQIGLFAQTSDLGAIGSLSLSKDFGESLSIGVGQELRANQKLTNFDRSLTSVEVGYTLIRKLLKAELGYDFIYQHKELYYEFRQRASFGMSLQTKLDPLTLKLRSKVQSTWKDESYKDYNINPKYVWRNKLECSYKIFGSPVKPFVSGEVFCPMNSSRGFHMDGYRLVAGVKYRTSVRTSWEFQLRYDQDIQKKNPESILYGGIGWSYDL